MEMNLEKLAFEWISAEPEKVDVESKYYCQTRDVFEARNNKMPEGLIAKGMDEARAYLVYSMAGELGNNSFDHNLGNWPDIMGVFYAVDYDAGSGFLVIADRGIGILNSLKKVLPDLEDDKDALEIAFTQKVTSRAPENRGNGLKFVRSNVLDQNMLLDFYSGRAKASLNHGLNIDESGKKIKGCLVILKF